MWQFPDSLERDPGSRTAALAPNAPASGAPAPAAGQSLLAASAVSPASVAAASLLASSSPNTRRSAMLESLLVRPPRMEPLPKPNGVFKRPRLGKGSAFVPPLSLGFPAHACCKESLISRIRPCPVGTACFREKSREHTPERELPESESSLMSPPLSPLLSSDKPASRDSFLTEIPDFLLSSAGVDRVQAALDAEAKRDAAHARREAAPVKRGAAKREAGVREAAAPAESVSPWLVPVILNAERRCISCLITETPCWRPSWDPNMGQLCNSCGLRYRKTRIRCPSSACRVIPSKMDLASIRAHSLAGELDCPSCRTRLVRD